MSSGIAPPAASSSGLQPAQIVDVEGYIDRRVEETRRHVRAVDLTVALLRLAIGVLLYLLLATVLDHWVLAEGLGRGGRFTLWAVLVLVGGWYFARYVVPLLIHRINPIFAAQTIERTRPTFKNGLINFLLLRRNPEAIQNDELARRVYQGLQVHTASELSRVTVGTTVDRLHVIRLGYLLAALVAICCLYFVLSPKNPLASFGRVILPWARIGTPTRVAIDAVAPGDAVAYQGDTLVVSAEIRGLRTGEPVHLYYSSVDGHSVDQSVPMSVPQGGFRHQGELPPGSSGFQHSLLYWIVAGDASSPTFRIDVQIPPAIVVDRVEYDFPAYTGLPQRVAVREGDLRAIEGTRVTIHGTANYPIAQAFIELEGDSRPTVPMTADGATAVGRLTLAMSRADPSQPEYRWYQLRFTDPERRENRRPIRHRIDVIPDQKPEVRLLDPPPDGAQLPVNGSWEFKVHAEDPDFGLRRVELRAEREGRGLLIPPLLKKPRPEKPHQGPFEAAYLFEPARLGLKPGDRIVYWAEAADCKEKADDPGFTGNVAETDRRMMLIVAEDPRQPPDQSRAKQDSPPKAAGRQQGDANPNPGDAMPPNEKQPRPPDASGATKGGKDATPREREPQQPQARPNPKTPESKAGDSEKGNEPNQPEDTQSKSGGQSGGKSGGKASKTNDRSKTGQSGEPSDSDQPNDSDTAPSDSAPSGKQGKASEASGRQGNPPPTPVDGDTNPGEAFERILEDQQRQQAEGRSGGQNKEKPSRTDSMASGQQPGEAQKPKEQSASGEQKPEGRKSGDRPEKSDTGQMPAGQEPPEQKASNEPSEGKKANGQSPSKGQRAKPTVEQPNMEGQSAEEQDADSDANAQRAKGKPAPKGARAKSPASDAQKMDPEDAQGPKGERSSAGGAGEKNTSPAGKKPDHGQSDDSPGQEKKATEEASGKPASKAAGKPAEPTAGPESEKPSGMGKDEPDASTDNRGKQDKGDEGGKASDKPGDKAEQGAEKPVQPASNADPKARKTDPQAKSGEKPAAAKQNGESDANQRGTGENQPSDSMKGDETKSSQDASPSQTPKGADPSSRPETAGAGQSPKDESAMPSPQGANQPRDQNHGESGESKKEQAKGGGDPSSPSITPKTSSAKSDSEGDRSADGKTGGGQQAKQPGEGMPGTQNPADQGNQGSQEKGEGEIGNKPGEQSMSDQATGKSGEQGQGQGRGAAKPSGGDDAAKTPQPNDPSRQDANGAKSGQPQQAASAKKPSRQSGSTSGNPTEGGGEPGKAGQSEPPPAPPLPPPDAPNLEYARKQTTLALEHLADQLAKDRSELLERLGWDRAYAENFLRQWQQMLQAANQPGPQGEAAKRELDKALKSLGLRPVQSRVQKATTPSDRLQQLQDTGRIPPPLEWRDYFKAYTEGVAGNKD